MFLTDKTEVSLRKKNFHQKLISNQGLLLDWSGMKFSNESCGYHSWRSFLYPPCDIYSLFRKILSDNFSGTFQDFTSYRIGKIGCYMNWSNFSICTRSALIKSSAHMSLNLNYVPWPSVLFRKKWMLPEYVRTKPVWILWELYVTITEVVESAFKRLFIKKLQQIKRKKLITWKFV